MRVHRFAKLFDQLFSNHSEYSLEERLFQSSLVIGILVGIAATSIGILLSLSVVLILAGTVFTLFQIAIFYLVRYKMVFRPFVFPVLALYFVSFIILWFFGGGIDSQNILLATVLLILSMTIVSERRKLYVLLTYLFLVILFYLTQFFFPSFIHTYSSSLSRWIDGLTTTIYSSFFIFLLVRYILKNYNLERDKAEQRRKDLLQMNYNKDRFMSVLSHDLKGPFSSLLGLTSILKRKVNEMDREAIEDYVRMIDDSANRTYRLLDNLLIWSASQQGKILVVRQNIIIRELFSEIIRTVASAAEAKNIQLFQETDPDMEIVADPEMMKTILRNLISNAVKFTVRGGEVQLKAKKNGAEVIISVIDNGTGISAETLAKLFDIKEFHSENGTEQETGTGLGLLICKDYVEIQGGRIWVDSKPGSGSAFHFTIPA